jgi:sarcosine/dimethylglycine N-methyltransferase
MSIEADSKAQTIYFYDQHPISRDIILSKLRASRGHLDGLSPDDLFPLDQDHYGGLAATDELARGAQISKGVRVADFCAGLGGTVRYLAHRYGADVTGIELTPARVAGAQELTRRVGLQNVARVLEGSVLNAPLADETMDAVVSQEAFCHVPDRSKALREAFRILKQAGRLAMTDIICHGPLSADDAKLMWDGMSFQPLETIASYRDKVTSAGFKLVSAADLTEEWRPILRDRLAMYQRLREEARLAGTPMGHDAFHESYIRFVALIQDRKLGGIRLIAER